MLPSSYTLFKFAQYFPPNSSGCTFHLGLWRACLDTSGTRSDEQSAI
jgi:hypothetical protein